MLDWLLQNQNSDGGWGYAPGRRSSLEPTALAALALAGCDARGEPGRRAVSWILARESPEGGFAATERGPQGSWASPLAVLALRRAGAGAEARGRALDWLLKIGGETLDLDDSNELNGSLRGWSWYPKTFSWIEPTAYAIIALKAEGRGNHARVEEAERMLLDRVCVGGGWNYGNKRVLGEDLVPFPQVSAKALIALRDRKDRRELGESARFVLEGDSRQYRSTVTRAWIALARASWGRPLGDLAAAVRENARDDLEEGTAAVAAALVLLVEALPGYHGFDD